MNITRKMYEIFALASWGVTFSGFAILIYGIVAIEPRLPALGIMMLAMSFGFAIHFTKRYRSNQNG